MDSLQTILDEEKNAARIRAEAEEEAARRIAKAQDDSRAALDALRAELEARRTAALARADAMLKKRSEDILDTEHAKEADVGERAQKRVSDATERVVERFLSKG